MADTELTGATVTAAVSADELAKADKRKKIIKYVIIAVIVVVIFFVVKKYVFKR
jgi:t-SNARE complex subunit (syntaxin)